MSKESLTKLLPLLEAMADSEIRGPNNIPVAVYLREALKLVALGERDMARLGSCGYREEMLVDMRERIGVLRQAESLWRWRGCAKVGAGQSLTEQVEKGLQLRDDLLAALRFALGRQRESFPIKNIFKGKGAGEIACSLKELAALANERRKALEAINFDLKQIDDALELAGSLEALQSETDRERELPAQLKRVRDAAFSYLREAVETLRDYARYVFRNDREQRERYASDYLRAKRKRLGKKRLSTDAAAKENVEKVELSPHYIEESSEKESLNSVTTSSHRLVEARGEKEERSETAERTFVKADYEDSKSLLPEKRSMAGKSLYDEEKDRCEAEFKRVGQVKKRCAESQV